MIENEVYLTHYIQQSCGWVKVHEYTCNGLAGAEAKEREVRARYPHDVVRFDIRYPRSARREAETVYYTESDAGLDSDDEGSATVVKPRTVRCECGDYTGERCEWTGSPDDTVVVEYMPMYLRASHEAAGNAGRYPHNGAVRIRCERSCAESIVDHDADWAWIIE